MNDFKELEKTVIDIAVAYEIPPEIALAKFNPDYVKAASSPEGQAFRTALLLDEMGLLTPPQKVNKKVKSHK